MLHDWLSIWYKPEPNDIIAYISMERIAEIGGADRSTLTDGVDANQVNTGMAVIKRWLRLNDIMATPVNVRGKTGLAFKSSTDAVMFKLVWI